MSMILTLSGMSTSGKTTLAKALTSIAPDYFEETVSVTTRQMRPGEVNGREYYFVDEDTFRDYINANMLTEHVHSHSAYYGTLKSEIERITDKGKSVVMVLEPEGVANIHIMARQAGYSVQSCFLDVDLTTLLDRFFVRIRDQQKRGLTVDINREADRMRTMLIKERAWSSILPWDIRLTNLHCNGEFDRAIGRMVDLHLNPPGINHSDFALSHSTNANKNVPASIFAKIIEKQIHAPIDMTHLAEYVERQVQRCETRFENEREVEGLSP